MPSPGRCDARVVDCGLGGRLDPRGVLVVVARVDRRRAEPVTSSALDAVPRRPALRGRGLAVRAGTPRGARTPRSRLRRGPPLPFDVNDADLTVVSSRDGAPLDLSAHESSLAVAHFDGQQWRTGALGAPRHQHRGRAGGRERRAHPVRAGGPRATCQRWSAASAGTTRSEGLGASSALAPSRSATRPRPG